MSSMPNRLGTLCLLLLPLITLSARPLHAQIQMQGSGPGSIVRIFNTDMAVLEAQDPRQDLPCSVTPNKPILGFDLKFHVGYEVSIPLRELAGTEDLLTVIFRVTPEGRREDAVYFSQRFTVPAIEESAKGEAYLRGVFDAGEGKYHVDWLMRDRSERVCTSYWDSEAELPSNDRQLALTIAPATVQSSIWEPFRDEPPVKREAADGPLNVKVLVNFAPQNSRAATLQPLDTNALVSILRSIAREPRITKYSIIAFNMHEQRVIYRQDNSEQINFPALGEALESLKLGTVDLGRLSQKHGETQFLTKLISQEVGGGDRPDALIFAGPKVMLDEGVPPESLKEIGDLDFPVFYMNYNSAPHVTPWRDAIGNAVKFLRGQEFTITRPRDLWFAWTEIMSRIVNLRHGRRASASASSSQ